MLPDTILIFQNLIVNVKIGINKQTSEHSLHYSSFFLSLLMCLEHFNK